MTFTSYVLNSSVKSTNNLFQSLICQLLISDSCTDVSLKDNQGKMWCSAELVLKTIMHFAAEVAKWEERDESKACMFLFGLLVVAFSPILAISVLFDFALLILIKIVIPMVSVFLMLCVGLPMVGFMRWLYNTYKFMSTVTAQLYSLNTAAITAPPMRSEVYVAYKRNDCNTQMSRESQKCFSNQRSRDLFEDYSNYDTYKEATLEL
ncbi:hypothetical protein ILUMI_20177 [Ignelater luminosus]|uniref:Uncharacterized protein n=1 Tax=Ignelater luminosus TaxID=2038154 RepID=A0A8K0CHW7_IGNLU|nr:hypothetical protein ILUMI_20177 [Ignelater luminosus]